MKTALTLLYAEELKKLKKNIINSITYAIGSKDSKNMFFAFPTSEAEIEEQVWVDAHVDTTGGTQPCRVGSVAVKGGECYAYLTDDFVGQWEINLKELPIEALLTILEAIG
jgi:hypothetical protein